MARFSAETGTRPRTTGSGPGVTLPAESRVFNTKRGRITLPPFAIEAYATASWRGVTRSKPCPIAADTVSPLIHGSLKRRSFHSLVGIRPGSSWGIEMRLRLPRLKPKAYLASRSTPRRKPIW